MNVKVRIERAALQVALRVMVEAVSLLLALLAVVLLLALIGGA